jgi:hypothetical protein
MKKLMLALAALTMVAAAGPAMACDDADCPYGGGKPPKKLLLR